MAALQGAFEFKRTPGIQRPARGDNRTGQAIWALGVDGRSRRIQPRWGGITGPTNLSRRRIAVRSNVSAIFLTFWQEVPGGENHCAAGRLAAPVAVWPEAMAAEGWFKALVGGVSCGEAGLSAAGSEAATSGTALTAQTAAQASASPAPNRSSRPGAPRSRAVFITIARTSPGFNAGLRSSIRATSPLT